MFLQFYFKLKFQDHFQNCVKIMCILVRVLKTCTTDSTLHEVYVIRRKTYKRQVFIEIQCWEVNSIDFNKNLSKIGKHNN